MKTLVLLLLLPHLALAQAVIPPSPGVPATVTGDKVFTGDVDIQGGAICEGPLTVGGRLTAQSNAEVGGDLIPMADEGGALGNPTHRWAYLYTDGLQDNMGFRVSTGGDANNVYTDAIGTPSSSSVAHDFNTHATFVAGGCIVRWKNAGTPKGCIAADGSVLFGKVSSLSTCDAAHEGLVSILTGGGGTRTKTCLCSTADASAFAWVNATTAVVGTSTTCG